MYAKLTEICDIQYGYAFDSAKFSETEGVPLVRIRDIVRGFSETQTTESFPDEYWVHDGDILIGMDGEFNIARWHGGLAALNQRVCRLIPKSVDENYIFHFMPSALKSIEDKTPYVTVKHLSAKELNKIMVPIPVPDAQAKIGAILNQVLQVIEARQHQLCILDTLIKARFVEMFGDPVFNNMCWQTMPLEDACKTIVDCPHSTPNYTSEDTGYMCIRTSIVKKNHIKWDEIEYIPEDEFFQRIQRKKPEKGDVIYTREGAILGIAAVIDRDCDVALGQRSMLLSPDTEVCTAEFLSVAMNFDSFLNNALKGMSGSASPHINVGDIKAFQMILPPIEQQRAFSLFFQQVNKSKAAVQQALEKAQLLFDSLMQTYFG